MKLKSQLRDAFELFQVHFDQLFNPGHELILPAHKIDWSGLEAGFVDTYDPDNGAPAKAIRLMVGLHYLKYAFNESDESVVDRWVENPYWQYFCGYTHMQHECPIHPTSMTKWRHPMQRKRRMPKGSAWSRRLVLLSSCRLFETRSRGRSRVDISCP